jgi:hypothetical protein
MGIGIGITFIFFGLGNKYRRSTFNVQRPCKVVFVSIIFKFLLQPAAEVPPFFKKKWKTTKFGIFKHQEIC